ncbi:bifunctional transcriptional activator/DNA repair enzyme AdaA [Caldalkalibacillus salinus]|uniref:bifunctional transcriptional activator/DNA repair enzyme AdaA n=1 Tax=Caldalkalibacillus salinus TaxID=2803787 RepID=UPI001923D9E7|nr:Ada metal-binding domain-containing protein [Caldalkalibacillus salinus]
MKNAQLSTNVMWEAVVACDDTFDGRFLYAVKTTQIFCRPSCQSKTPHFENVCFFDEANEAIKAGFRPCKRCQPQKHGEQYDPHHELVTEVREMLEQHYQDDITLADLAHVVGASPSYLNRVFKHKTGRTPRLYLEALRIEKAKTLLSTTSFNNTQICYQVGYLSLSSFYHKFKRYTGFTPRQYRKKY